MAGRGGVFFFSRRDGAVLLFFRGGTGRVFFFSEAGRGGFFFFFRRDGTGRCCCFFRGPGRDGCFWRWQFFWRDGAKSLHRPAKGGLNRPASRPCKALGFLAHNPTVPPLRTYCTIFFKATINILLSTTSSSGRLHQSSPIPTTTVNDHPLPPEGHEHRCRLIGDPELHGTYAGVLCCGWAPCRLDKYNNNKKRD